RLYPSCKHPPLALPLRQRRVDHPAVFHQVALKFPSQGKRRTSVEFDGAVLEALRNEVQIIVKFEDEWIRQVVRRFKHRHGRLMAAVSVHDDQGDMASLP